ncbi:histidine triad (HIT) family protein [Marinobacter sp. LV10R510-11A]|uniref:histidine triad nucleotide-binding protein n=1 Tax=Marinobacter sp. LV10R510-11A TaxID=1415568 RepID=UPI000BB8B488|nr:histidine triad nucleotide-binding protein [Marinobacter sp. LV10R510-11A]SOB77658.1 histidine triad (HIT) family protein [Marinobacter sp. LV10R510-11A]
MSETLFTKIINREIPADIVYEDDISLAFRDINPQAPVHLLIIPKKVIPTINDIEEMDRELAGHLFWVAAKLAKEMGFAEDGYRTVMNCGENSGQTVFHIHLHLLAGKPMGWPPYTDKMKQA